MSYEIIYDKQFIKVKENLFVPILLAGSSNCFDWSEKGNERRSRSWFPWSSQKQVLWTKEELLADAESVRAGLVEAYGSREDDPYDDKQFGYFSAMQVNGKRNTTYGNFKGLFITGCAKALTVEELRGEGVAITLSTPWAGGQFEINSGLKRYSDVAKSGEHLIEIYELLVEYLKGTDYKPYIEYSGMFDETPKWIRKKYFPTSKKKKVLTKVKEFWTVGMLYEGDEKPYHYLSKFTSRRVHYAGYPYLKYRTEKEAQARCNRSKRGGYDFKLVPWKVEKDCEVYI